MRRVECLFAFDRRADPRGGLLNSDFENTEADIADHHCSEIHLNLHV